MTPYEETKNAIREFKKRENKLKLEKKRIDIELEKIQKQKMILAIIISGGNPKYVEGVCLNGLSSNES